jgi:hypothetical protein
LYQFLGMATVNSEMYVRYHNNIEWALFRHF